MHVSLSLMPGMPDHPERKHVVFMETAAESETPYIVIPGIGQTGRRSSAVPVHFYKNENQGFPLER